MGDKVVSDTTVGEHTIEGRRLEVHRLTWRDAPGLSFDVIDAETGDVLTEDESFDQYPTTEQLAALADVLPSGHYRAPCPTAIPQDGPPPTIGAAPDGANPWRCASRRGPHPDQPHCITL